MRRRSLEPFGQPAGECVRSAIFSTRYDRPSSCRNASDRRAIKHGQITSYSSDIRQLIRFYSQKSVRWICRRIYFLFFSVFDILQGSRNISRIRIIAEMSIKCLNVYNTSRNTTRYKCVRTRGNKSAESIALRIRGVYNGFYIFIVVIFLIIKRLGSMISVDRRVRSSKVSVKYKCVNFPRPSVQRRRFNIHRVRTERNQRFSPFLSRHTHEVRVWNISKYKSIANKIATSCFIRFLRWFARDGQHDILSAWRRDDDIVRSIQRVSVISVAAHWIL